MSWGPRVQMAREMVRQHGFVGAAQRAWARVRRHAGSHSATPYERWIQAYERVGHEPVPFVVVRPGEPVPTDASRLLFLREGEVAHQSLGAWLGGAPAASVLYGDVDVMTEGRRHSPWLKPAWSPDMMTSCDLLGAVIVDQPTWNRCRTAGVRPGTREGNAWLASHADIEHVPRVFVHRTDGRDPFAVAESGALAPPVAAPASISVIVPTRDRIDLLKPCVEAILPTLRDGDELIIVDTGSGGEAVAWLERAAADARVTVCLLDEPFNYSAANNLGARSATGDVLTFLNNDTETIDHGWRDRAVHWAKNPSIGCVGAQLVYPDGRIQHGGMAIGLGVGVGHMFAGHPPGPSVMGPSHWTRNVLAVTGAFLSIRRSLFEELGGFDERFTVSYSDAALCLAAVEAGFRNVVDPAIRFIHKERQTRGRHTPSKDDRLGREVIGPWLDSGDPYWPPGLSGLSTWPSLRRPNESSARARFESFSSSRAD